jgi:hypothetical protein
VDSAISFSITKDTNSAYKKLLGEKGMGLIKSIMFVNNSYGVLINKKNGREVCYMDWLN